MNESTIAFIGAGNMASSIIGGLINNGWPTYQLIATARTEETLSDIREKFNIETTVDNHQAVGKADVIMLCVKPQVMKEVLTDLSSSIKPNALIISVAAGITMESLQKWGGEHLSIVRSMPNTPSLLQCGASGLYANNNVSNDHKKLTDDIFNAIGIAKWVDQESLIDAVIAVSGSGPAYYFLLMEIMEQVGSRLGLDNETSRQLTLQTALGAARMATESSVDAAELRRRITSPKGTTEQAIKTFQEQGLPELVEKAMNAAVDRSIELAEALKD
ncbi:pyrroline-5-carboxylate reductase [Endozoicomonas elysicola]|uniref:Pyrroline-5-carboxylate reductase n=1 Tax=Endozoicomonas elysicola TaxID=305900 RepID=A0A081K6Z5_9GAMM|nr:pyrroline-5-carboxylate reductase [Endozoicomonas elysicola]KEI69921.1 pyrroline-5-carboxylate reductase [Endozoicomonas elysicola]